MGVRRGVDDTMYILVDGEDMGFVVIGIVKVDLVFFFGFWGWD